MREDPIVSGAWIKAALVVLVGGALGVGGYLFASGVDVNLPDLDLDTGSVETTISETTLESTTVAGEEPPSAPEPDPEEPAKTQPAPAGPSIEDVRELGRCTQAANGDLEAIQRCFERFSGRP